MMLRSFLVGALLVGAGLALMAPHLRPLIIYNPTPSVPVGFYRRAHMPPKLGDFVTIAAARAAPAYAHARAYDDPSDYFLKRVRAVAPAEICAIRNVIRIDGAVVAVRAIHDAAGRRLPTWRGCVALRGDQVFLMGDSANSFDGRYWGASKAADIEGVWRPLAREQ